MARQLDKTGLDLLNSSEGCRLTSYQDQRGVWTIGWGSTGPDIGPGMTWTQAQADWRRNQQLAGFCSAVDNVTHDVPTTDNQFAAMVDLCYNIGAGAFDGSTVLQEHRAGQYDNAAAAFLLFDKTHINGVLVEVDGLLHRRQREAALYLTP